MNHLIPLLVAIPLGVAFLVPLAVRLRPGLADLLSSLAMLALLVLSGTLIGQDGVYAVGGWKAPIGIELRVDELTVLMLLTINGLGLLVAVYSIPYLRQFTAPYRYYSLLLLTVAGANGVVLTGDLFNLYVFMEIATIASYGLVAYGGEEENFEASFKYAVIGSLGSSLILIGIALVYGLTGTVSMAQLAGRVGQVGDVAPLRFALALFLCGFGVKSALVPFHTWLPDAYPAAPAPASALLSGVISKAVGLYVLARLLFNVFGASEDLLLLMRWMGGVTMVVGGLMALGQWDIKRLYAYSSVSQVGLILLSLGFGSTLGVVGALYHLANHAAFKGLLFLGSGQVEMTAGTRDLRRMHGLSRRIPLTAATSLVGSLALAGIPPLNGFWSKLIIVLAAVQAGHPAWALLVVLLSIVSLAYQLKVQTEAFYGPAPEAGLPPDSPAGGEAVLMAAPMLVLAIACGALSLLAVTGLQRPLLVGPAAEVLMKGVLIW